MNPIIRKAGPGDLSAVQAIVEAAYAGYIPRMGRKPGPMEDDYAARIAEGVVWVLEDAGQVWACLVLTRQIDALLLDNIAVHPDAQGRGYGGALLRLAEATALEARLPGIRLYTNAAMVENIALYQRIGYVETHRAVERGLRRVYFWKALDSA